MPPRPKMRCVACKGKGVSSAGKPCVPCRGTGLKQPPNLAKKAKAKKAKARKARRKKKGGR